MFASYGRNTADLAGDLADVFAPDGTWCRIGTDVHALRDGEAGPRLRPVVGGWEAGLFHACWGPGSDFEQVPPEYQVPVAAYIGSHGHPGPLQTTAAELRAASALGGLPAAHALAAQRLAALDGHLDALDRLQAALATPVRRASWAQALLVNRARDVAAARETLTSAFLEFHLGVAGVSPSIHLVWGFDLPSGLIDLESDCGHEDVLSG